MLTTGSGLLRGTGAQSLLKSPYDEHELGAVAPTIFAVDTAQGALFEPPSVLGRDIGLSAAQGSSVLYVYGDTIMTDPTATGKVPVSPTRGNNSVRDGTHNHGTTATAPGSMTTLTEDLDANGFPTEFIQPVIPNDVDGTRHALWIDSLLPHPSGAGWVAYYQKVRTSGGGTSASFFIEGIYVADITGSAHVLTRTGNEVLLWPYAWTSCSGFVAPDGFVYLYTAGVGPTYNWQCSRVLHANYKNPASYTYWDGSGWNADITQAKNLVVGGYGYDAFGGAGATSVTWNAYLSKFVMVHAHGKLPSSTICVRTADNPQGPWTRPAHVSVPASADTVYGIYTVRQHSWAQQETGRVIFCTYARGLSGFNGELRIAKLSLGPAAPTTGVPTTIMTTSYAGGWGKKFSDDMDALTAGSTYTVPRGVYEIDFRTHPQNSAYRTCITVPNNITFDFSQAELRLRSGQPRMTEVVGGVTVTSGQLSDVISNRGLGNDANKATGVTIKVGCLNGQGASQGSGTNQQGTNECWFDGIAFIGAQNCTITGDPTSPWAKTTSVTRPDGSVVTVNTYGVIKNIRGWDGNGGVTETFSYDFLEPRGGNLVDHIETMNDDGANHTSTGGSCNSVDPTITQNAATPILVTHSNIWGHHHKSHGATSYQTVGVARSNSIFENNTGAGFRYEYGWNHTATDVVSRNNVNLNSSGVNQANCLNLKGEQSPPATTVMLVATGLMLFDSGHGIQTNSIVGLTASGWERHPANRSKISMADQLYGPGTGAGGGRLSSGINVTSLTTVA